MEKQYNLQRFLDAQRNDYEAALAEIKNGKKRTHWMWYIFPQIQGLGFSETSRYYAISGLDEAKAYLEHPVLGKRLTEIAEALIETPGDDAFRIFGSPDDLKLRSSMTLFASVSGSSSVFQQVLDKFFDGKADDKTSAIIGKDRK